MRANPATVDALTHSFTAGGTPAYALRPGQITLGQLNQLTGRGRREADGLAEKLFLEVAASRPALSGVPT